MSFSRASRTVVLPSFLALSALGLAVPVAGAKTPARPPLTVTSVAQATKTAPVTVRLRTPSTVDLHATLNGRTADDAFAKTSAGRRVGTLTVNDGLRYGANRLRIRVTRPDGRSTLVSRTIRVARSAPLADAGEDVSIAVGRPATVGVASGGLTGTRKEVTSRWRIVKAPRGSKATVAGKGASPRLQPDRIGTYVLRHTVTEADGDTSHDTVTVSATPDDPPAGVRVDTLYGAGMTMRIAGSAPPNTTIPCCSDTIKYVSFAVIERATRRVVESNMYYGNATTGLGEIADKATRTYGGSDQYLMIVSAGRGVDPADTDRVTRLAAAVGGTLTSTQQASIRSGSSFSFVGVAGGVAGGAWVNIAAASSYANIGAQLQRNVGTERYDLVATEHPQFDTKTAASAGGTNVMRVGDKTISASLPADSAAGFHVVALDSRTLETLSNQALPTDGAGQRERQQAVADALYNAMRRPGRPLILVQTIGKPKATQETWNAITAQLINLGGSRLLVNGLDGNNEYALVGRTNADRPVAEAGSAQDSAAGATPKPPGRLSGILARTRTWGYESLNAGPGGSGNNELLDIVYRAPEPFPAFTTPGEKAAETYIARAINSCAGPGVCDLRREYFEKYSAIWGTKLAIFPNTYPGASSGFTEAEFTKVHDQLRREIYAVANVKEYFAGLQRPFVRLEGGAQLDLNKLSEDLYAAVQPPPESNTTSYALGLVGKIIALGAFLGPPTSAIASGISAGFALSSYLTQANGRPAAVGAEIRVKASALSTQLTSAIDGAFDALTTQALLLVSDWGKLRDVSARIDGDWALPASDTKALTSMKLATKQYLAEALVPVAYPHLITVRPRTTGAPWNARELYCKVPRNIVRWWDNMPDNAQTLEGVDHYDAAGNPVRHTLFFSKVAKANPTPALADLLFRPDARYAGSNAGLGLEKFSFMSPRVFGRTYMAVQNTGHCILDDKEELGPNYDFG